jgi:Family of unknown function (DUF5995)
VVERMVAIASALPPEDGVARFNELYLAVTREVAAQVGTDSFADPAFISRLDVVFAQLYFDAVDASDSGGEISRAWAPLFEARSRDRVAPIQFALAGMNAHINYDLGLALVKTCEQLGRTLERGSDQHRDYLLVNSILERVQERVTERFATGIFGVADEALGRLDDVIAIWKVARARDAAWNQAETLLVLRRLPRLHDEYLLTLGRHVGLAGRGLLIPVL